MNPTVLRREAERQRLLALSYREAPERLAYARYLDDIASWIEREQDEPATQSFPSRDG